MKTITQYINIIIKIIIINIWNKSDIKKWYNSYK